MPYTPSPLRYPGGKTKIYALVKSILNANDLNGTYIEPFAGGSGLAIKLLLNNDIKRIVINDSDPAIYAFWRCVLRHTNELCDYIESVSLTYDEWNKARNIYFNQDGHSEFEIGTSTLFLNRVNVSGVLKGGLIGGKDQTGKFKMDARFNRDELVRKVKAIAEQSHRIDLYNLDVLQFLSPEVLSHYYKVLINFDPPYVEKGSQLYMNSFTPEDHQHLRDAIASCRRKWIVTYDVCDLVSQLYSRYRGSTIDIYYSANCARKAKEYIFFSNNLLLPEDIELNQR